MNDIINVVMISLTSYHAFSTAGITVHSAPAHPATRNRTAYASGVGHVARMLGPKPATSAAPSRYWPSYPRFQMPARKTTIRPSAIRSRGAIRTALSCQPPDATPPCRHQAT